MRVLARVPHLDGYNIRVEFTKFDVPIEDDTESNFCLKDVLQVYDSDGQYNTAEIGNFCGKNLPTSVSGVGKNLLLVFDTRWNTIAGTGFEAKFTLEPTPEILKKWREVQNAKISIAKTIPIHLLPDWRIKEESLFPPTEKVLDMFYSVKKSIEPTSKFSRGKKCIEYNGSGDPADFKTPLDIEELFKNEYGDAYDPSMNYKPRGYKKSLWAEATQQEKNRDTKRWHGVLCRGLNSFFDSVLSYVDTFDCVDKEAQGAVEGSYQIYGIENEKRFPTYDVPELREFILEQRKNLLSDSPLNC